MTHTDLYIAISGFTISGMGLIWSKTCWQNIIVKLGLFFLGSFGIGLTMIKFL